MLFMYNIISRIENLNLSKQQVADLSGLHLITIQRWYDGGIDKARESTLKQVDIALKKEEDRVYNFIKEMKDATNKEGC